MKEIKFSAYLPAIQSAIKRGPDGARIQLEVPQTENEASIELERFGFDKVLKVTVEIEDGSGGE